MHTVKTSTLSRSKLRAAVFMIILKYSTENKDINYLINTHLVTKSKFKDVGLDIRSAGGYVVCPPSKINNVEYKFIRGFDEVEVMEIPENLIGWLLTPYVQPKDTTLDEPSTKPAIKTNISAKPPVDKPIIQIKAQKPQYSFIISEPEVSDILDKLSKKYLDNYSDWLIVTTVMKNLNNYELWDKWSKQSNHYNSKSNNKIWGSNLGPIDINYLIHVLNNTGHKLKKVLKYKIYIPITNDINCKKVEMNEKYVHDDKCKNSQFKFRYFKKL